MASPLALIVGLGNPGPRYEATRHNAGFWFVDALANSANGHFRPEARFHGEVCKLTLEGHECWLLKPATFMNRSGQAALALAAYYKIGLDQILAAHDELDLPPGTARLKQGGGHGGHNGLRSLMAELGGAGFWRLRLGIGHPGHKDLVTDYVLGKPSQEDRRLIESAIGNTLNSLADLMAGEMQRAMRHIHTQIGTGQGPTEN